MILNVQSLFIFMEALAPTTVRTYTVADTGGAWLGAGMRSTVMHS